MTPATLTALTPIDWLVGLVLGSFVLAQLQRLTERARRQLRRRR